MSNWIHGIYCFAFFSAAMVALNYRRMAQNANNITTDVLAKMANAQSTAVAYLDAAKLIRIDRTARLNVFTFARHDKMFTIQTIGVWDDNPTLWREQAGLIPPANTNATQG